MVTLINDYVAVVGDDVAHGALAYETLHDGDVDQSSREALSSTDGADRPVIDLQKGGQAITPLIEQLRPVNDDERIGLPRRNDRGGSHCLAECGRSAEDADIMGQHCLDGLRLLGTQHALEADINGISSVTLVFQFHLRAALPH